MGGGIFHITREGRLVKLTEQEYDSEDILQKLLSDYPDLLGSDQIGSGEQRWLLVEREIAVPDADGDTSLSLDHLFLDQDGIPTFVEVKRSSDTRLRREVVGQMLDYASNGVAKWSVDALRERFEARVADPEDAIAKALGRTDVDVFWQQVKTNLQAGRIRMLFVADVIPGMLRRIVEFLNEQMDPAEALAVEVKQYASDDAEASTTLVPRVLGQTQRKRSTGRGLISEPDFERGIRAVGGDYWEAVCAFRQECEALGGWFKPYSTGMGAYFPLGKGNRCAALLYIDTRGEGILWPLNPDRLQVYAQERDDLTYFTPDTLADYQRRLEALPESFRQPTRTRDKFSTPAGKVDVQTFTRFLDMLIDFYRADILPKRS